MRVKGIEKSMEVTQPKLQKKAHIITIKINNNNTFLELATFKTHKTLKHKKLRLHYLHAVDRIKVYYVKGTLLAKDLGRKNVSQRQKRKLYVIMSSSKY